MSNPPINNTVIKSAFRPKWRFWAARILGKRVSPYAFYWRGAYWIYKDMPLEEDSLHG